MRGISTMASQLAAVKKKSPARSAIPCASPAASKIDPERIGFFGFSLGGYTGLVVIGANPDWAIPLCQKSSSAPTCEQILRKEFRVQPLTHDPRVKAAVIADPFSTLSLPQTALPL
jgi:predicted dienelactone hydrolase